MSGNIVVLAPHPDDETLGCGGTLLRHQANGDQTHWLICTQMTPELGFSSDRIKKRKAEIEKVSKAYSFTSVHEAEFATTKLDRTPVSDIVNWLGKSFEKIKPDTIYLPFPSDIHSDHRAVFQAAAACTKWFRYSSVKRVLVYETISETEFQVDPTFQSFRPNIFVNIEPYLERKLEIMKMYEGEMGTYPFPRSETAIRSLAQWRGATAGTKAAEAFSLVKEIQ